MGGVLIGRNRVTKAPLHARREGSKRSSTIANAPAFRRSRMVPRSQEDCRNAFASGSFFLVSWGCKMERLDHWHQESGGLAAGVEVRSAEKKFARPGLRTFCSVSLSRECSFECN